MITRVFHFRYQSPGLRYQAVSGRRPFPFEPSFSMRTTSFVGGVGGELEVTLWSGFAPSAVSSSFAFLFFLPPERRPRSASCAVRENKKPTATKGTVAIIMVLNALPYDFEAAVWTACGNDFALLKSFSWSIYCERELLADGSYRRRKRSSGRQCRAGAGGVQGRERRSSEKGGLVRTGAACGFLRMFS